MSPFQGNNKNTRPFHTYNILNAGTPFFLHVISGLEFVNSPLIVAEASSFAVFTNVTFSTARKASNHIVDSVSHPSMLVLLFSFNTTVLLVEMCQARKGKKRERERNEKETHSFLSYSSIFGHPFFPFLATIMKNG